MSTDRPDILVPDAEQMRYDDGWANLTVDLGEGVAFLALTVQSNRHTDGEQAPAVMVSFDPKCEVPVARQLGEILIAWADAWQDEYDRFNFAPPCGINQHPDAQPNPACKGEHDENGVCL